MRKIIVEQYEVLNVRELLECLANDVKHFLIDEGPDLEKVMIGDMPLQTLLSNKDITIETYNLIQKDIDGITIKRKDPVGPFYYPKDTQPLDKEYPIEKHFGLFVNTSRWHRLLIASHMFRHHKDKTFMTYRQNIKDNRQPAKLWIDDLFMKTFNRNTDDFIQQVSDFVKHLPIELTGEVINNMNNSIHVAVDTVPLHQFYKKLFLDIVCETWHEGECFYPTEKTSRPIVCHTPFVIYGPKNYLANLHKLGFKTFSDWWDETYDQHHGVDRILMINRIIAQLANKTLDEIQQMHKEMKDVLTHNYNVYKDLFNKEK